MSERATEGGSTRAARTLNAVREGLARRDTACVSQVLEIIQQLSGRVDQLSVQDLADIVGRDLTTVAKIMRAANCLGYNPTGADVTTLPEAIGVIGFETIRNLVISLLLIESAEKRGGRNVTHEVAATALGSALVAQVVGQRVEGVNAEQAFVAGALRHYGKLLLSTFLPDDYVEAQECGGSFDDACLTVFGIVPLEVGRRILAEANLPKVLRHALDSVGPELIRSKKLADSEKLIVVSDFAVRIAELLADPAIARSGFKSRIAQLLNDYSASIGLDEDGMGEVLAKVSHVMAFVGQAQGYQAFESVIACRLHNEAEGCSWPAVASAPVVGATPDASEPGGRAVDVFATGLVEVEKLVHSTPVEARRAFSAAARCLKNGLGLRSCVVFIQRAGGNLFSAELGVGPVYHEIRDQPLVNPEHKDVFSVCLKRGEDILIRNPDDPNIAPFIPAWFKASSGRGPLALFPVRDLSGTFAILCGVVSPNERIELTAVKLQHLKKLRGYLGTLRESLGDLPKAA